MADIGTEKMAVASKETGPTTKFGTALVGFADRMDALASKETNLTHRQMWLAIGTEAVIGAFAIARVGSDPGVDPLRVVYNLMGKLGKDGFLSGGTLDASEKDLTKLFDTLSDTYKGGVGYIPHRVKIADLARALIGWTFQDFGGERIALLDAESTRTIVEQLENLKNFEGKRDQLRNLFLLGGVGSAVVVALHTKAGEKVKVSAPVGKMPAVLPTIANVMKGIGELF